MNLNVNEYTSALLSQKYPHNCVLVAEVNGAVNIDKFLQSVNSVAERNPILRYSLYKSKLQFGITDKELNCRLIRNNANWEEMVQEQLKTPFDDGDVLARVILFKHATSYILVICFHHVIADGMSIINFLTELIKVNDGSNLKSLSAFNEKPLKIYPQFKKTDPKHLITNNITKFQNLSMAGNIVSKISSEAKRIGINVNTYFIATIFMTMCDVFKIQEATGLIPVDIRKKLNEDPINTAELSVDFFSMLDCDNYNKMSRGFDTVNYPIITHP